MNPFMGGWSFCRAQQLVTTLLDLRTSQIFLLASPRSDNPCLKLLSGDQFSGTM